MPKIIGTAEIVWADGVTQAIKVETTAETFNGRMRATKEGLRAHRRSLWIGDLWNRDVPCETTVSWADGKHGVKWASGHVEDFQRASRLHGAEIRPGGAEGSR